MTIRGISIQIKPTKFFFLAWLLATVLFGLKGFILYSPMTIAICLLQTFIVPYQQNAFFSKKS